MLDFNFDGIDETLDSEDESVIAYGNKRKVNKSPKKTGKCKSK